MSRPIVQPFFETMNHGVRTRRSQHQVTYELPGRSAPLSLGRALVLAHLLAAIICWSQFGVFGPIASVTSGFMALQVLILELSYRTRKTRVVLTSDRLTVESRVFGIGTSWECEIADFKSLERLGSPVNMLFVSGRKKRAIDPRIHSRATADYLYREIMAWYEARTCTASPAPSR